MTEEQLRALAEDIAANGLIIRWLLGILSGSGVVIATLFWLLLKSKEETNGAYREVAPIATASLESSRSLDRLVRKSQDDGPHNQLGKAIERVEEVAKRLERYERGEPDG